MAKMKKLAMSIEEAVYAALEIGMTNFNEICVYVNDTVGYVEPAYVHNIITEYYGEE